MNNISVGDVVISVAGRDKGKGFLVVEVKDDRLYLTDGKMRKVSGLKGKNPKHVKRVESSALHELAERIRNKECVGNDKVKKAICSVINKKQEK